MSLTFLKMFMPRSEERSGTACRRRLVRDTLAKVSVLRDLPSSLHFRLISCSYTSEDIDDVTVSASERLCECILMTACARKDVSVVCFAIECVDISTVYLWYIYLLPGSCGYWPVRVLQPPWSCCEGVAEVWPGVLGCARASPPGSASGAAGSTSRPSARPPPSSGAAGGSAALLRQSRWRSVLAGQGMLASQQELMSWRKVGSVFSTWLI